MLQNLDIKKLVQVTVEVMKRNHLNDLGQIKITRRPNESNVWNQICLFYFGSFSYKESLRVSKWWSRNTKNYKQLVLCYLKSCANHFDDNKKCDQNQNETVSDDNHLIEQLTSFQNNSVEQLNRFSSFKEELFSGKKSFEELKTISHEHNSCLNELKRLNHKVLQPNYLVLQIDRIIFQSLKKFAGGHKRLYFKSPMSFYISNRLQKEHNVNCWFQNVYNWIKKLNSNKEKSPYWYGHYKCIEKKCLNFFKAYIIDYSNDIKHHDMVMMHIYLYNDIVHEKKISPKIFCRGDEREQQALHLIINGTMIPNLKTSWLTSAIQKVKTKYYFSKKKLLIL